MVVFEIFLLVMVRQHIKVTWFYVLCSKLVSSLFQLPANCIENLKANKPDFTRVNLPNNSLFRSTPDETCIEICNALASNEYCTEVDMAGNGISNSGAEAVAELLKTNKTITKLDLSNNKVCYFY